MTSRPVDPQPYPFVPLPQTRGIVRHGLTAPSACFLYRFRSVTDARGRLFTRESAASFLRLDQLVDFWCESRPHNAPFYKILRQAAAVDDEMAELERTRAAERLRSYRSGASLFAKRGALRDGLSLDDAAAIIYATGHPDVYRFLVIEGQWTADQWATWVRSTLEAGLLAP